MHSCPDCGQACACDGEDAWHGADSAEVEVCRHVCEPEADDLPDEIEAVLEDDELDDLLDPDLADDGGWIDEEEDDDDDADD